MRVKIQNLPVLQQNNNPQCVGMAVHNALVAHGVKEPPSPNLIYQEAQKSDQWKGEDYDGTSIQAALFSLKGLGVIEVYARTQYSEEKMKSLLNQGIPLLCSIRTGDVSHSGKEGGSFGIFEKLESFVGKGNHAILVTGFSEIDNYRFWILQNSWGKDWGSLGCCYIEDSVFQKILNQNLYYLPRGEEKEKKLTKKQEKILFKKKSI